MKHKFRPMKKNSKVDILRFSLGKFKPALRQNSSKKEPTSTQITLQADKLPDLPTPPSKLQNILIEFNRLNEDSLRSVKKKSRPKNSKRTINGFFAFRTFYSKSIFKPDHQRQLSSLLAEAWREEKKKSIWDKYAVVYRLQAPDIGFFDWLCANLNLETSTNKPEVNSPEMKKHSLGRVEDLFLSP
ncbi:hypothetical protein HYPBUDRAFT_154089 [Hyphopichia burtonii NRRL Y-1933]|uniref:Alpha box domain-containing protein n=1 Tax=Hyphopichia burtonii NRRL Y-1933 TaxID=984485 RepID=A0A1E4RDT5_9ASCO|nr:hypothetical protein HYPBUDRAFT_154089 [Hyphopichia burtonii NRRL Y-1933]ODV65275.1 hypothetical protein HYPBUDRAFT_154089 [Hyphopichia burtonii NRRL Y-1933]